MGQYNKAITTAAGENLIARAVAGEIQLDITKAKTSDYKYPDSTDFKALTDLQGVKQVMDYPETKVLSNILSNNLIQTRTLFSNEEIEKTYYIHNIGLYAMDGTQEVLFCIVTAVTPDEMPQYNGVAPTSYIYNIQSVVQDAAELNVTVHPSGTATIQDVLERVEATGGDISGTVVNTLEPIETKFPIPSAGESIKRFLGKVRTFLKNIKPLEADVTYYVATTGSDITGDGTQEKPFRTIQYCIDKLPRNLNSKTATIVIANGLYSEDVVISGFNSGALLVQSPTPLAINTDCIIKSISIHSCSGNIALAGLNIQEDTSQVGIGVAFVNSCQLNYITCIATNTEKAAISAWVSDIGVHNCNLSNHKQAILAQQNSRVYSDNNTGSNNSVAIYAAGSSMVSKNGTQPNGTKTVELFNGSTLVNTFGASIGALSYELTLYVATTGSDITGNGTQAKPFRSIQYAIDMIPKNLNGYKAIINVANGTYDEHVYIESLSGGSINLVSESMNTLDGGCNVKSISAKYCSAYVYINGFVCTHTEDAVIVVWGCHNVMVVCCQSTASARTKAGMYFGESHGRVTYCRIANRNVVLQAVGSMVVSENWDQAGSVNNDYGLSATYGATIYKTGAQPTGLARNETNDVSGTFINERGTQISNLIESGLSCTWGTRSGGYVRHGNIYGDAIIEVNLRIEVTTNLTAGTQYTIPGFPVPIGSLSSVAVTTDCPSRTQVCYMNTQGYIIFVPAVNMNAGTISPCFSASYKTNS